MPPSICFAYATIEPHDDGKIMLNSIDKGEKYSLKSTDFLDLDGNLDLIKGIYNRVVKDFTKSPSLSNFPPMWMHPRVQDWDHHLHS